MVTAIKYGNLTLAFLLELCALAALGYWGFHVGSGTLAKVGLGIGVPLLIVVVWGLFIAPRATVKVPDPVNLVLRLVVFGLAVAGLAAAGQLTWAWVLGAVVVVNLVLVRVLGQ
ncbi:MAG: YrdB family protein [Ktedonobacterales bacterium]